jgi:hypothetical protein
MFRELKEIVRAWLAGEGDLPGLLLAWYEVITGQAAVDDPIPGIPFVTALPE